MDIFSAHAYLPGDPPGEPAPLSRFLPPIQTGSAEAYLQEINLAPGSLILDPFGSSPSLVVEMARLGYRVLSAVNNPINRFLMEMAADPPTQDDLRAALAELASSKKGSDRLEAHLQALYQTTCPQCSQTIQCLAFIWEKGADLPLARLLDCPNCGASGEFEITAADNAIIKRLTGTTGLHRARLLERVASLGDPDRPHVQETLEYYLPRPIYGLVTIINKMDSLLLTPRQRRDLNALVLTASDEINTLWNHPPDRPRPLQLTIPGRFREKNLWLALEKGVGDWARQAESVPVSLWPNLPPESGGLCLFEGPLRDLAGQLAKLPVKAVVTVLPRPNQAFWSLSALWAGWLWGSQAVAPYKHVLRRQRYDWSWHAAALHAALKNMNPNLDLNVPVFALLPEPEPSFVTAALLAGSSSGFALRAIALRSEHDPLQIHWQRRAFSEQGTSQPTPEAIQTALQTYLQERGEPVTYLHLHCAALAHMADAHQLTWQSDALATIHAPLHQALEAPNFRRHEGTRASLETGLWDLAEPQAERSPLPDRVEKAVVNLLTRQPDQSLREIEIAINNEFPGLLTPQQAILENILASYGLQVEGLWQLRPEDNPTARRADLHDMSLLLENLGKRLGYRVGHGEAQTTAWRMGDTLEFTFFLLASALLGEIEACTSPGQGKCCLVIPGGRAGLLAYKLKRLPALAARIEGWQVIKNRQVRLLADDPALTRERWLEKMSSDPIQEPEQMRLF